MRAAVASMIQLPVYKIACRVLDEGDDNVRAALSRLPETIRGLVRDEAAKLYRRRRDAKKV